MFYLQQNNVISLTRCLILKHSVVVVVKYTPTTDPHPLTQPTASASHYYQDNNEFITAFKNKSIYRLFSVSNSILAPKYSSFSLRQYKTKMLS